VELDPKIRFFLDSPLAQTPPVEQLTPQLLRDLLRQYPVPVLNPPIHAVRDLEVAGAPGSLLVRLYTPSGARNLPLIVFFHGGGFVMCTLDTYDDFCKLLANYSGCAVASVEYRLAPENPFPGPLEDCYAALKGLAAQGERLGIDPTRLAVAGDSAGGNLATATALLARDRGGPALRYQALIYPCVDPACDSASARALATGYLLRRDTMQWFWSHYLTSAADRANPLATPLRADLKGLPAVTLITGEFDPLRDEGRAYVERLQGAGINTIFRCHPGMIHLFYGMRTLIPYADTAFKLMGADIRSLLMSERRRGKRMTDRLQVERLVRELHAARVDGDLEGLCRVFSRDARLRIGGSGDGKRISLDASGMSVIRPWLSVLVKTFRLSRYQLLSLTVEGMRAAVHWRVDIHSKITGAIVPTELMDLIEVSGGRVASLTEFFVPC
jgi:acetyl esterase